MSHTLQELKSNLKTAWQRLLLESLSFLRKVLENGDTVPFSEKKIVMKVGKGSWNISTILSPDFYYWVLKHGRELIKLPVFEECIRRMTSHDVLANYDDFHLQTILLSFVAQYLEKRKSVDFHYETFETLYEEYIEAMLRFHDHCIILCPLFNFECEVDEIELEEGLKIRKLSPEELNELYNFIIFGFEDLKRELPRAEFVIEYRLSKTRLSFPPSSVTDNYLIDGVLFALRLIKEGRVWGNVRFSKLVLPWERFWGISAKLDSKPTFGPPLKLEVKEIPNLKKLWKLVRKVIEPGFLDGYDYLSRAIRWFNKSYSALEIEDRFIWLVFSLEALCSEPGDTAYKISNRIAMCIASSDDERIRIRNELKRIYQGPRNIVHGRNVTITEKDIKLVEGCSRKMILNFILLRFNGYDRDKAIKLLDDCMLSEEKRREFIEATNFDRVYNLLLDLERPLQDEGKVVLLALKEELEHIKSSLESFAGYQSKYEYEKGKPLKFGLVYKLVKLHGLQEKIPAELWARLEGFYKFYESYLMELNKAAADIRNIIIDEVTKIRTEKDDEKWKQRVLAKLKAIYGPHTDVGGICYPIECFLRDEKPKSIPHLPEDRYLLFDSSYTGWDMKITLDDLNRVKVTLEELLNKLHKRCNSSKYVKEVRKRRNEMLKLTSELIREISTIVEES